MSGAVRPLFGVNSFAPTASTKAEYLEQVAKDIRTGKIPLRRGLLVYTDEDGGVGYMPFGESTNYMELVGLLEFAKAKIIAD